MFFNQYITSTQCECVSYMNTTLFLCKPHFILVFFAHNLHFISQNCSRIINIQSIHIEIKRKKKRKIILSNIDMRSSPKNWKLKSSANVYYQWNKSYSHLKKAQRKCREGERERETLVHTNVIFIMSLRLIIMTHMELAPNTYAAYMDTLTHTLILSVVVFFF